MQINRMGIIYAHSTTAYGAVQTFYIADSQVLRPSAGYRPLVQPVIAEELNGFMLFQKLIRCDISKLEITGDTLLVFDVPVSTNCQVIMPSGKSIAINGRYIIPNMRW